MSKYLEFVDVSDQYKKKTKTFEVKNKTNGSYLGQVSWAGGWRKYTFTTPHSSLMFDTGCLDHISSFIKELMGERKVSVKSISRRRDRPTNAFDLID